MSVRGNKANQHTGRPDRPEAGVVKTGAKQQRKNRHCYAISRIRLVRSTGAVRTSRKRLSTQSLNQFPFNELVQLNSINRHPNGSALQKKRSKHRPSRLDVIALICDAVRALFSFVLPCFCTRSPVAHCQGTQSMRIQST